MKILVTGGAGFIGSAFLRYWYKNHPDDEIINLDAFTYAASKDAIQELDQHPNYRLVVGDITNAELVNELTQGVDLIVHFAAETHVDRSIMDPSIFVKTNVLGTQILLESAVKNKVGHFHHISTDEVFGSLKLGSNALFSEETPYDPRSPYSASKAGSDHLVRAYGETFGLPYTITNCSNNYGPFQHPEKFISLIITNLLLGKSVPLYGAGHQVRDWLFVDDHVRAIELIIQNAKPGSTYCIGGMSEEMSNLEVVKTIADILEVTFDPVEFVKDRAGHDERYAIDWSKIKADLGWSPQVDPSEGFRQTIEWYKLNTEIWKAMRANGFDAYYAKQYQDREKDQ